MCKSKITLKKYIKLLLEVEFYNVSIYAIFLITGYAKFTLTDLKVLFPYYGLGSAFVPSYLVFYLFIPFLNILINGMNEWQHKVLVALLIVVNSVFQTFLAVPEAFTYVGWFMALYIIAAYIRLYPIAIFENKKIWRRFFLLSLLLSIASVVVCILLSYKMNRSVYYWFVSDSNKILAITTAVGAFMWFKNLKLSYHPIINKIAASAFGVQLIHSNCGNMSKWLWQDIFKNTVYFHSKWSVYILHAIISVFVVYAICTIIDMVRIALLEKPTMKLVDKILKR
jgi:hypothetical protein